MERRLNAELWDKMHYLFRDFNDRMVHVELNYDFVPDIEALKTVIICAFEKVPVLRSKFVDTKLSTHWEVKPYVPSSESVTFHSALPPVRVGAAQE